GGRGHSRTRSSTGALGARSTAAAGAESGTPRAASRSDQSRHAQHETLNGDIITPNTMRNHTPVSRKLRARALRHFPAVIACAALSACASLPASRSASGASRASAAFDVVIRNGRVLDGAGNPWILADVAIKDGRFAKI